MIAAYACDNLRVAYFLDVFFPAYSRSNRPNCSMQYQIPCRLLDI